MLKGQSGLQDLTVAAKCNALDVPFTSHGLAAHDRGGVGGRSR